MKKRIICLLMATMLMFSLSACKKSEEAPVIKVENEVETETDESQTPQTLEEPTVPEEHDPVNDSKQVDFNTFAGNYSFSSGAGGWSTDITLYDDGTFSGEYHDSDMGDTGPGYPNGTLYLCKFSGKFTELQKKDEFTYTCSLENITQETPSGKEEVDETDGIYYIYSEPYGFDNAKDFEFYLPGKSVGELDSEFTSWLSLRYNQPYPDTLQCKSFCNLSVMEGFEEFSGYLEDVTVEYPDSLPLDAYQLAGAYYNSNLKITMNISAYTDYIEGDEACGNITWEIPDDCYVWNDEATFLPSDNGFDVKPGFYGHYKIIVTDNTNEHVVIHLYDSNGRDCGEYVMTTHFES